MTETNTSPDPIVIMQAEVCKAISNPHRVQILRSLQEGEQSAANLIETTSLSKANLSQHMSVLKNRGIVTTRKEGVNVHYKLSDSRIAEACKLMREAVIGILERGNELLITQNNGENHD